jgi:hypothetical protein
MLYLDAAVYSQTTTDPNEKLHYAKLAEQVKKDYVKAYVKPDGNIATGSQAALALSISLKLYDNNTNAADVFAQLLKRLEQDRYAPSTGEVAFRYLLETLSAGDCGDIIWTILSRTDKPGYGYMLKQLNMKTLSERWDKLGESMNHCMFGHAQEWFSQHLVGIRLPRTSDIFENKTSNAAVENKASDIAVAVPRVLSIPLTSIISIAPKPAGDVTSAEGYWNSPFGKIESAWRIEDDRFKCRIKIPANLTCEVRLPTTGTAEDATLDRIPLPEHEIQYANTPSANKINSITLQLGSGVYEFETKWRRSPHP